MAEMLVIQIWECGYCVWDIEVCDGWEINCEDEYGNLNTHISSNMNSHTTCRIQEE